MRPEKLRKAIADALHDSGLPRTLLAKDAGLARATLEAWLSGLRNPSEESVVRIASAMQRRAERLQRVAARLQALVGDAE